MEPNNQQQARPNSGGRTNPNQVNDLYVDGDK